MERKCNLIGLWFAPAVWVLKTLALVLLAWNLLIYPGLVRAQGTLNGDTQGCAIDQPCFNENHQVGNTVVFKFTAICCWDFFNVRYPVDGGEKQVENKSGSFTFRDVKPNRVYRISVQGCNSHTLAHSTCSDWSQSSVTTAGETGSVSQPLVRPSTPAGGKTTEPVKSIGRVNTTASARVPICEAARDARARNSPAAPSLEAQCRAQGGTIGATIGTQARGPQQSGGAPIPICDEARSARERNSPAAASLEAQCRASGGGLDPTAAVEVNDFAAAGAIIANSDPLAGELRRRLADLNRRGFDIGLGATGAQTEWGPGKQKILNSLSAADQEGFKIAASFALDRNRNIALATVGAAIAETDAIVAKARMMDSDVRYWLGFDIASGIFGDPAHGAKGNTATGPGSLAIRDGLSEPAQRGFNASTKFHFGRHY